MATVLTDRYDFWIVPIFKRCMPRFHGTLTVSLQVDNGFSDATFMIFHSIENSEFHWIKKALFSVEKILAVCYGDSQLSKKWFCGWLANFKSHRYRWCWTVWWSEFGNDSNKRKNNPQNRLKYREEKCREIAAYFRLKTATCSNQLGEIKRTIIYERWNHHYTPQSNWQTIEWTTTDECTYGITFVNCLRKEQRISSEYYVPLLARFSGEIAKRRQVRPETYWVMRYLTLHSYDCL